MRILAISIIITSILLSGCAKILSPGATEFKCSSEGEGVCADVTTVYRNRHNIDTLKAEKKIYDEETYISEKCEFLKTNNGEEGYNSEYDNCVSNAKREYKQLKQSIKERGANGETEKRSSELYQVLKGDEGIPLRQPDEVISIWVAPYKTDTGDLVYSHYIYAIRKKSDWLFTTEDEQVKSLKQSKQYSPLQPFIPENEVIK